MNLAYARPMANLHTNQEDFQSIFDKSTQSSLTLLTIWASWHPPSVQITQVTQELAAEYKQVQFVNLEAETAENLVEKFQVNNVPTSILFRGNQVVTKVEGASPTKLVELVKNHVSTSTSSTTSTTTSTPTTNSGDNKNHENTGNKRKIETKEETKEELNTRLKILVTTAPVMIFIKGTPTTPKCGFSRELITLLNTEGVLYSYFDILSDQTVREGLKDYSNWRTYPQLYINGELIGGLDVIKELHQSGEFISKVPKDCKKTESLEDRLKGLICKSPVMIFIKGSPSEPKCGFSKKAVGLLNGSGVQYGYFDILTDNDVREGLKKFSNWPTYPQLYVKGELIGGVDVMQELQDSGELASSLK